MSGIVRQFSASFVVGLVLLATVSGADEEKITADKLPKKVLDVVKARFPGAEFTSIIKETADGKVLYDLEMKVKGKKAEMDIQEDGTIVDVEKELDPKDLPAAVTKAVEAKYPKSKILEVGEVSTVTDNKEKVDHYEVIIETAEKKRLELEMALDGKIIKEEELK